jgi:imidazolonepropionase-like amidohydrolase
MLQVLKGGTLIDGTGAAPRQATLILDGNRIMEVRGGTGGDLPENAAVYDATGKTITPGLIDAHDHLANIGMDLYKRIATSVTLAVLETAACLKDTLEAGITGARDANGLDWGLKAAVERGIIPGPRLTIVVGQISPTGGHHDREQRSGVSNTFPRLPTIPEGLCDGPDEVRKKVREMVKAGADQIKTVGTGGISSPVGGPLQRQFTREEMFALVDEAHAWSKRVMVHAYGGPGLQYALEAGCDSIEHGGYLWQEPESLRLMADRGVYLVPTISNSRKYLARIEKNPGATPEYIRRKAPEVADYVVRTVQAALQVGVPIAMGTDAGMFGHGDNAYELECMVDAGMSPSQAIVASTKTAAECSELHGVGTLEVGKLADLLVVDGDPLQDVRLFRDRSKLLMIMKDGMVYKDQLSTARREMPVGVA